MDMNQAFPSNYLREADLQGRDVTVTIDNVRMENMQDGEEKPVVYFQGKEKGLVLNKTNTNTIIDLYGPQSETWRGRPITLFPTQTEYQGRQVACIRVRIQAPQQAPQQAPAPAPAPAEQTQAAVDAATNAFTPPAEPPPGGDHIPF